MIVAAVDDLLFAAKISQTARNTGVDVIISRSLADAIRHARKHSLRLMIVDLNSVRCEPISLLTLMKKDDELRSVPTLGFASHVRTDLFEAAKDAGCDRVLARSAFSEQLPLILSSGDASRPRSASSAQEKGE